MTNANDENQEAPEAPEYGQQPAYPVESVDSALRLLLLVVSTGSVRLADASRYLDVASSTALRLMAMLQYRGLVARVDGTKAFGPGPELEKISYHLMSRIQIDVLAHPVLEQLSSDSGETVHLGRLEGGDIFFIAAVESSRAVRVASRLGRCMPAHCTSSGKVLLAALDNDQLAELYPDEELSTLTGASLSSRAKLMAELEMIREISLATNVEESEEGVTSVAIMIPTANGRLALNLSVPTSRMPDGCALELATQLRAAGNRLEQLLS